MYEVQLRTDKNFEKMLARMGQMTERVNMAARDALLASLNLLRNAILQSGRVPYKTGTLRRSITTAMEGSDLYTLAGHVGTNLPYAIVHEIGGTWTFHRNTAFGRPTKPYTVTAHYKARRYIGDTFFETLQEIQATFTKALTGAVSFA